MTTTEAGTSPLPMTAQQQRAADRAARKPERDARRAEARSTREERRKALPPKDPAAAAVFEDRERFERAVQALERLAELGQTLFRAVADRVDNDGAGFDELEGRLRQLSERVSVVEATQAETHKAKK